MVGKKTAPTEPLVSDGAARKAERETERERERERETARTAFVVRFRSFILVPVRLVAFVAFVVFVCALSERFIARSGNRRRSSRVIACRLRGEGE